MASAELQTLCRTYPRAKGLCVIIANSRGNLPEMPLLEGVKTDLVKMKRTFETLKFAVMTREDCSAAQMVSLFHCVALFSEYPPSYRRIAVVFAGHGVEGALCAHDGTVPIDEILGQFQPGNCHPSIGGIPKLFFIDSCRGKQKMEPVVVERGATAVPSKVVSPRGNILVAYSTLEGYKAHEAEEGGIWATELSKQLLHDKSLPDIIVSVNQTLMVKFQNSALSLYLQQPECNLTINECINLLKESKGVCTCVCMSLCMRVYVCMCMCMVYTCVYVYVYGVYLCVCAYTCVYVYWHIVTFKLYTPHNPHTYTHSMVSTYMKTHGQTHSLHQKSALLLEKLLLIMAHLP